LRSDRKCVICLNMGNKEIKTSGDQEINADKDLQIVADLERVQEVIRLVDSLEDNKSLAQPSESKDVSMVVRSGLCEPPIGG